MDLKDLKNLNADTSDCVQILYDIAIQKKPNRMLELGVRIGVSTLALLLAAKQTASTLVSIDVDPCPNAQTSVKENNLQPYWKFIQADDRKILSSFKWVTFDYVFIDTSHQFMHTLEELRLCDKLLNKEGVMLLHDTLGKDFPDVMKAVNAFLKETVDRYDFKELGTRYGLGMLTKKG